MKHLQSFAQSVALLAFSTCALNLQAQDRDPPPADKPAADEPTRSRDNPEREGRNRPNAERQNPNRPNADRPGMLQRPGQGRFGQGGPGGPGPGQGGPGGPGQAGGFAPQALAMMLRNLPVVKALDADEDGQLSPGEIENASKSLLKLDKNGDGIISQEEMRPDPAQMPMFAAGGPQGPGGPNNRPGNAQGPEMMMRMFESRDANKDGKLTDDEIPPQMRERISNIDSNNDGAIDRSEIERAMRRFEGMRPGNRPERAGSGGQNVPPRRPQSDPDSDPKPQAENPRRS
jgi:Ca2+-binding EF-hand superfamily protein